MFSGYPQTATYWPVTGTDGYGGHSFGSPQTLAVRWVDKAEQFLDARSELLVSKSVIWVEVDVSIGGYLKLGVDATADPTQVDDAYPIKQMVKVPSLRNLRTERRVYL